MKSPCEKFPRWPFFFRFPPPPPKGGGGGTPPPPGLGGARSRPPPSPVAPPAEPQRAPPPFQRTPSDRSAAPRRAGHLENREHVADTIDDGDGRGRAARLRLAHRLGDHALHVGVRRESWTQTGNSARRAAIWELLEPAQPSASAAETSAAAGGRQRHRAPPPPLRV